MGSGHPLGRHRPRRVELVPAHRHPPGRRLRGEGEDLSVLWTELPFVVLAAGVLPVAVWLLTVRLLRRSVGRGSLVVIAAAAAVGVTLLYAVGLYVWADQLHPAYVRSLGSHLHL